VTHYHTLLLTSVEQSHFQILTNIVSLEHGFSEFIYHISCNSQFASHHCITCTLGV